MKIKITYTLFILTVVLNLLFVIGTSIFTYDNINKFNAEKIDFIQNINLYEQTYEDKLLAIIDSSYQQTYKYCSINHKDTACLNTIESTNYDISIILNGLNNKINRSEYNCNNILVYSECNDSLIEMYSAISESCNKNNFKEDSNSKNRYDTFKNVMSTGIKEQILSYYDEKHYHISKFYTKIYKDYKYILVIEFNTINPDEIIHKIILSFTLIFTIITILILFTVHYMYYKLNILGNVFTKYLNDGFIIKDYQKDLLSDFSNSRIYEIEQLSYNILSMINVMDDFTMKTFISGERLNTVIEYFKTIFEESPIGIMVINHKNEVVNMNSVAKDIYNKILIDYPLTKIFSEISDEEEMILDSTGTTIKIIKKVIGENYYKQSIILIIDDISKEKELQKTLNNSILELKEANEMLLNYSYIISHDIKNPLRTINMFTQKILIETNIEKRTKYSKLVESAVKRIDSIITDSLFFSKATNKNVPIEEINVISSIEESINSLYESISQNNVTINKIFKNDLIINGNYSLITNMFQNFISNGIKFNDKTNKILTIIISENDVFIIDNGIGIEQDYKDRVFETFYRINSDYEGTGLGLSIVKKIADRFNIKISIQSELNVGSTFKLSFNSKVDKLT